MGTCANTPTGRSIALLGGQSATQHEVRRPEVAAVLVPEERRDLLELDLTKLTYG